MDFTPPTEDITIVRGDSVEWQFECVDANGDTINFTATTVVLTVNQRVDGVGRDLFTLNPTALDTTGILTFQPTSDETKIPPAIYYYDVEWTYGSHVQTIVRGKLTVLQDISN